MINKTDLPILEHKDEILSLVKDNSVIIVAGETGSGKTTQLPQFFLEAGYSKKGKIAVTQPRRIAATSTATRVAEEMNSQIGEKVGYRIRFHALGSDETKMLFMTDGILLNEILCDRNLSKYSVIMIDEAHERSLNIDFLLGYLKGLLKRRKDLKVVISSATIDTEKFSKFFNNAPVVSVSGRCYPVEVIYQPLDEVLISKGEQHYVNAAVEAVRDIVALDEMGDILIFMPTEKDITETVKILTGSIGNHAVILPLFSRLTRYQQNRIFSSFGKRKIVVSTNIAETSLTVPGIKFVVDTGVARIKRYSPRLRTNQLPIDQISQASANQRKGRCGRIAEGLCVRLYSEQEFSEFIEFEEPEIRRTNLAGVILNMISMRIGSPINFPFIDPPEKQSFTDAFAQLRELGAINKKRELTSLGKKMGRIPLEPHISRMILEAERMDSLYPITIIAAGLSIADPRERPSEKKEDADNAHKRFVNEDSDFLTLLNLWIQYEDEWNTLKTQNSLRKFCKQHFLSFNRMREWHDIHQQITRTLKTLHIKFEKKYINDIKAIHYPILSGLLSNIAEKNREDNSYHATRGRELFIFPGSVMAASKPQWIMCQEIVETSRVFGRTVAPIEPIWLEEIAPELIRYSYSEPFFDEHTQTVMVWQEGTFFGLPVIKRRKKPFAKQNRELASEIFSQEALADFKLKDEFPFLKKNRALVEQLESAELKLRKKGFSADIERMTKFYFDRINGAASIYDLKKVIRKKGSDKFLEMKMKDISSNGMPEDALFFPDELKIGEKNFALKYAFDPGTKKDGVTITVPLEDVGFINNSTLDWLVPAMWEEKVVHLLRTLPKTRRKIFVPIPSAAKKISKALNYAPTTFTEQLSKTIRELYSINLSPNEFDEDKMPDYLKMRIEIKGNSDEDQISSRNLADIKKDIKTKSSLTNIPDSTLKKLFKKYEQDNITEWNFGDIQKQIIVKESENGFPLYGYPALAVNNGQISIKVFSEEELAFSVHIDGVIALAKLHLLQELDWIDKELKFSKKLKIKTTPYGGENAIRPALKQIIEDHFFNISNNLPYTKRQFEKYIEKINNNLKGVSYNLLISLTKSIAILVENRKIGDKLFKSSQNSIKEDLFLIQENYIKDIVSRTTGYKIILEYPRYLEALKFRIEKAALLTGSFKEKMKVAEPYINKVTKIKKDIKKIPIQNRQGLLHFIMMVEEFLVSLFAQQRGTKFPISEKRLEKQLDKI